MVTLALSALQEALAAIPAVLQAPGALDVLLALPEARPGFLEDDATNVVRELRASSLTMGKPLAIEIAGRGHAGALEAARVAVERIESGRSELCAIVGTDSYFDADTIDWLDANRQIASPSVRDGFPPGEAAGCMVVASEVTLRRFGLTSLGKIRAVKSAIESHVIKGAVEGLGRGLTKAVAGAASTLLLPEEAIDAVFCDINGERYRTEEWGFTVLRVGSALRAARYSSVVSCCGDVGAASGVLLCVLAVRAWARNYAAGPRALIWCSSEGGLRSAAVVER
ncbi:MAG TPA: hypothetical protein VEU33_47350 [Archangium sp.]|nr:hypothetical protein [Archangium sp.]